jgi:hypothetical protein
MSRPERIELDRQLIDVRSRMSRLRARLTARPNPPDLKADLTLQLKFYGLMEHDLQAQLELHDIARTIREMRSMIANGFSAVRAPSFRTNTLALYAKPRQSEKLRTMIQTLKDRRYLLEKQIVDWKLKELPRWKKVIARIERRNVHRRRLIEHPKTNSEQGRAPRQEGIRVPRPLRSFKPSQLKMKIAELKFRDRKALARKICELLDGLVDRGHKGLEPLQSWQKRADGKRTWVELYDDHRTRPLVRAYINKVPPLLLS